MVFSIFQFFITAFLAVICARAISLSAGDIPVLATMIPALWILPQGGIAGLMLLAAMVVFGLTLPLQPITMSVAVWVLVPIFMVMFSRRSNLWVVAIVALIVVTLNVGIMSTQAAGKLGGTPMVTLVQSFAVFVAWYAARNWKGSNQHSWWSLALVIPIWAAGLPYAALVALCLTGMIASMESLSRLKTFSFNKLLCWTLPSVGFAALVVFPGIEVPRPVFVVWLCLLGTAWMTDYILTVDSEHKEV
ncbi:hypothetical protein LNL84_01865 [Vibrio sp. ZSDZ34]|jgi:hypothetical protein|uniref:Uncharacterized protein n=1 Tax=Vibrio gelatinilyticus TaxID=2893468 RepID=A0A9X1W8H6_9VIBR|nr:hypothetical protein [Vibrio gelatinilyticus]MCJ2375574.1 hypothetical protein [Vibrio gelatinilyticus]